MKTETPPIRQTHFHSIVFRLTLFALVISLVPVLGISMLLQRRMERMTERELNQSYRWLVSEYVGNIQEKLQQYVSGMQYTAENTIILDNMYTSQDNAYVRGEAISKEIFKTVLLENRSEIRNCMVYSMVEDVPVYGSHATMLTEAEIASWKNSGWDGGEGWFISRSVDNSWLLSLIRPIHRVSVADFTAEKIGVVKLDIYLSKLFAPAYNRMNGNQSYEVILYDGNGQCLYPSASQAKEILQKWLDGDPADDAQPEQVYSMDTYAVLPQEMPDYGVHLLFLFDNGELIRQKQELQLLIFPSLLLITIVIVVAACGYFRRFSHRVKHLLTKFQIAGTGDLTPREPVGGDDEIAVLDWQFGQMLVEMDRINRQNLEQKMEIREEQYQNLQLQINPHFLYNTLETISAIAAVHEVFQVCDLCEKLGDIFRYSLGKNEGKYATVAREIGQIRNYVFIQQVRYQFEVFYSIDVEEENVYMLRFILQPVVENAVLHGLSAKKEPGTLEVNVSKEDDDLVVRISDDGVGMTKEETEQLQVRLNSPQNEHERERKSIGLWNISQRIRLSCGEKYGITVLSKKGQGTTFVLRLPYITGIIEGDGER